MGVLVELKLAGGVHVVGATPEMERVLRAREKVALAFIKEKGKSSPSELTMEEILELRARPEWKNP